MKLYMKRPRYEYELQTSRETEFLLIAVQKNTIRNNYSKLESILPNRIASVDYVEKSMKQFIIL